MTLEEAELYQPFVEQAGNQVNFPNATGTNPFALTGTVVRYLAIGGAPLSPLVNKVHSQSTCRDGTREGILVSCYPQTHARHGLGRNLEGCRAARSSPEDAQHLT